MMDKWKLYNETKNIWEYVISNIEPTTLPDNPGDDLRVGSQVIVEENIQYNYDDIVVAASVSLNDYKALRYHEIDAKTGTLVSSGFVYATFTFSLSQNAQINISALNQSRDELSYPITYNSADDINEYNVVDATDMHNMYLTALATKKTSLDSGSAIKAQVRAAVDRAEVDAVIDNR
jgi:hypothetical protein